MCTFNNEKKGTLRIYKQTDPAGGVGFNFSGDIGSFALNDGESYYVANLVPGDYDITETVPVGMGLDEVTCEAEEWGEITDGVTIDLQPGENAECTFHNDENAQLFFILFP